MTERCFGKSWMCSIPRIGITEVALTRKNTLVPPPRYSFGLEHDVRCEWPEHPEIKLRPRDVSKGHLSLLLSSRSWVPAIGELMQDLSVYLDGRQFELPKLSIRTLRDEPGGLCVVLWSVDCELTAQRLWELSYALRMKCMAKPSIVWNEHNLPKVPARGLYTEDARQERLGFIREQIGVELPEVSSTRLESRKLVSNIEALIGSVEIPVGLAGPLQIQGVHAEGLYYAPMATSEGALVASATRGATALSRSGGVNARVLGQRMMRVPLFSFDDMSAALFFAEWVQDHEPEIAEEIRKYSNFARLVELRAQVMGRNVHVHFIYETGDAAGQNMTTTCTWQACQWIIKGIRHFEELKIRNFLIEANLSNDKKVTYQTFLKGRGVRVLAEAVLTDEVCLRVLKVSASQLVRAFQDFMSGSVAAGMVGFNINVANVVAAMFTALGQDIACVHESALAQLHMELNDNGDAYCTMTLPSLVIGTVGGGTNLPQQRECLSILGCVGAGNSHKLAEIIAAFCLALDISTLSAIAADQFARAHEKLGRNRVVNYLKLGDLTPEFFELCIQNLGRHAMQVESAVQIPLTQTGSSIITELTSHKVSKMLGHFPFRLETSAGVRDVMVKVKPLDGEVILMLNSMAAMCDARLAQEFNTFREQIGFKGVHIRELAVMSQSDPRFVKHAPQIYGIVNDPAREAWVIVEELLCGLELMDSADDTSGWQPEHMEAAVRGIAEVHAIWYGREQELLQQPWLVDYPTTAGMTAKRRLWELLGVHAREEFPEWFSDTDLARYQTVVGSLGEWWAEIEAMPRTLVHNDFNPRNIAFRRDGDGVRLCAYDWELATLHLPQHDLVELLGFTLNQPISREQVDYYLELHRTTLEQSSGIAIDTEQWRRGYVLALLDMTVNRIPMYLLAHTFRHYAFMERVHNSFRQLLELERWVS
ncbi:peedicted hydroxymethylglutaryl-CoA reductase [gamma proteobacterium HdN1]|nr:peedicted hydroxymethylglutaryl-CoA reductase [gamma proteobacterium HdN1]